MSSTTNRVDDQYWCGADAKIIAPEDVARFHKKKMEANNALTPFQTQAVGGGYALITH
ncbi:hypothetical protein AAH678_01260 [Sodalis endosymbiont of Spalangia cameroni]|uniref:hypothetical protein n=1 Tax=Sodalis praecaptivus TaxID=1239307 RepID=UPI0031F770F6